MVSRITRVHAAQRLDSRGQPTVQVILTTDHGRFTALVPSGASKGDYEAIELRDGDKSVYEGNGVEQAVDNVRNVLGPALIEKGFDVATQQAEIDRFMCNLDGSEDKGRLGANAILGISMAATRAGAASKGMSLYRHIASLADRAEDGFVMPVPFFNVLNGGVHSGNPMAFQEMMIAPVGAQSFKHAVQIGAEVYSHLKTILTERFGRSATGIGDEGGFAPPVSQPHEALDLLQDAIDAAGHSARVKIGIDPASSEFYDEKAGTYDLGMKWDKAEPLSKQALMTLYHKLLDKYPVVLLEDPFAQDDWDAWTEFNEKCLIELVGDDLLATNIKRIKTAGEKTACNSLLLKINQIGTISEAIEAAKNAYALDWAVFVSHRSGETTDDFIADLTVGLGTGHLKGGSPCRGERVAKYNRLMDIEDELRADKLTVQYAGESFRFAWKNS